MTEESPIPETQERQPCQPRVGAPHKSPIYVDQRYIKMWTSDFLAGVVDLNADETGCYAILLVLMADRGGPLPDDAQWLARRCNMTTRSFNRTVARLIDLGKIERRNGMLGNQRMMMEMGFSNR